MKKALISVIISLVVGVFFFFGSGMDKAIEAMILGVLLSDIDCIVYAIDSKK